jgi:hypothetical protein
MPDRAPIIYNPAMNRSATYPLAVSAFLTAMLMSNEMKPGVQLAGAGGLENSLQRHATMLTGSAPSQPQAAPALAAPREISPRGTGSSNAEPLRTVAQLAEMFGETTDFSGPLATLLGASQNNKMVIVKQVVIEIVPGTERTKDINVWAIPGTSKKEIILVDDFGTEAYFFRTSSEGVLISSLYAVKGKGPRLMTAAEALPRFDTEVAWWLRNEQRMRPRTNP